MTETEVPVKPKKRKAVKRKPKRKKQPMYRVILWNDDDHTFEYVIRMMEKIFHYDIPKGMEIAVRVHTHGKVDVAIVSQEVAELRRDQIRGFGPDELVKGCCTSMFATIEPTEE